MTQGTISQRVLMKQQSPDIRRTNFLEVPLGYTSEEAINEASRCIQCKKPQCVKGCPVGIDIPGFIRLIGDQQFQAASRHIKKKNAFPAICGRVCPQEDQCEGVCVLAKKGQSIAIGNLERFVADYEAAHPDGDVKIPVKKNGVKIAVVGSGPAGLTVAADLALLGYSVTIFEALHKPGGVLLYGIPEFRLPKSIVKREVDYLRDLGVQIQCNVIVGSSIFIHELFEQGYQAIFVGTGAGLPMFLDIPGENLIGVYSANEYLSRSNLMKAYEFPKTDTPIHRGKKVAVFGGGNVAMDSARTAIRLGAEEVHVFYRRTKEEMPARQAEIHHAQEEGVVWQFLTSPLELMGNSKGDLEAVKCIRMELQDKDLSGRRRPVPIPNSEFITSIDTAIVAIGNGSNPLLAKNTKGLEVDQHGHILVNEKTGQTSLPFVYAGGDIVTGAATVILAAGAGRIAANAIHEHLTKFKKTF